LSPNNTDTIYFLPSDVVVDHHEV